VTIEATQTEILQRIAYLLEGMDGGAFPGEAVERIADSLEVIAATLDLIEQKMKDPKK
jgi:hypothetical protein